MFVIASLCVFFFCSFTVAQPPPNDLCVDATPLAPPQDSVSALTIPSSFTFEGPSTCGGADSDIWFKVLGTGSTCRVTTHDDFLGGGADTVIDVFKGTTCGMFTPIACDDGGGVGANFFLSSVVYFAASATDQYWIRISAFDITGGDDGITSPFSVELRCTEVSCEAPLALEFPQAAFSIAAVPNAILPRHAEGDFVLCGTFFSQEVGIMEHWSSFQTDSLQSDYHIDVATAVASASVSFAVLRGCRVPPTAGDYLRCGVFITSLHQNLTLRHTELQEDTTYRIFIMATVTEETFGASEPLPLTITLSRLSGVSAGGGQEIIVNSAFPSDGQNFSTCDTVVRNIAYQSTTPSNIADNYILGNRTWTTR